MPGTRLPRQRVILPPTSSVPVCYHPSRTKHKDTVTPARPPQFAAQREVSASCKKAACLIPWGQGRRGGKGAPGELQIINNHFSCCSNSRIEPARTGRAGGGGGLQPSAWISAAAGLPCPRGARGRRTQVSPAVRGRCRGVWASAAGSTALLLLLVRCRNLAGARSRSPLRVPQAGKVSQPAQETAWLKEPRQLCCR